MTDRRVCDTGLASATRPQPAITVRVPSKSVTSRKSEKLTSVITIKKIYGITSFGQAGGLNLWSELDGFVQFDHGHVVVKCEDVEILVRCNLLHPSYLFVVLGDIVAAEEDLQLVGLERIYAMGSGKYVTVSDQRATAVELSLPLESDDPGEFGRSRLLATNNPVVSAANTTHFEKRKWWLIR